MDERTVNLDVTLTVSKGKVEVSIGEPESGDNQCKTFDVTKGYDELAKYVGSEIGFWAEDTIDEIAEEEE